MKLILFNQNKLTKLILPKKVEGSFWLTDELNQNAYIINIESQDEKWILKSNFDAKIISGNSYVSEIELKANSFYVIEYNKKKMLLFVEKKYNEAIKFYTINQNQTITVGKTAGDITYNNDNVQNDYMTLTYLSNKYWKISIKQSSKVYVNDFLLKFYSKKLTVGDVIYIYGLRIVLYNGMISVNNISNMINVSSNLVEKIFSKIKIDSSKIPSGDEIKEIDLYNEEDYFYKKPRMRRFIENYPLTITSPPQKNEEKDMPVLLVMGPMLTMAVSGLVTFTNTMINIFTSDKPFIKSLPSLITSVTMLISSLLWPNLTKRYQKKQRKLDEKRRVERYTKYLEKKRKEVYDVAIEQSQILKENLISLQECQGIALKNKRILWERGIEQKDFLTVRLGHGDVPMDMDVSYSEEDFTMYDDDLKDLVTNFVNEAKVLKDVPVGFSFFNKQVVAIMGGQSEIPYFMDNILLQLLVFHSFEDLKLVFFVSNKNKDTWEKYKEILHTFSNNKEIRFFASDIEDIKYVSSYLEQEYLKRANEMGQAVENEDQEKGFIYAPYYLIITDDYPMIRSMGIVDLILKNKMDFGFGIVCVENSLSRLPSECTNFISIQGNDATILSTDLDNYKQQKFIKEIDPNIDMNECCKILSNIPIKFTEDTRYLPTALGFLEMYNVGKVEHLNSLNRWKMNNPIKSLKTQIGINDESNPIYLDLHEKFHGPHGLIAGTTGSGKSEFIITYILSMVVNYSPNEVAFILIDYKGGGLAGAFENKTQGIRLPHLAGTITNLDKASLNRTLVSINSELQRRQTVFNEARDKLGESTIDIYKYQNFFREGKLDEPMPHLFIISDEFAELKSQQPEFMADLISAARIGRSLGVHLILATQKPSGVVNDQIWSNTKFRVCLKVQDRSDSNEMLKKPDAADITNSGRFYLQVGNDEIYVLGQSGWAGTKYVPSDSVKQNYDRSISYIDEVGTVIRNISETKEVKSTEDIGDELSNVLKYVVNLAEKENVKARNLWLDSIPADIYVDELIKKYKDPKDDIFPVAIVGEYDAPAKQYQDLLTLNLNDEGNTLIYGISGANREMLISSLVYSLCTRYKTKDINIYILDFGSESLRIHSKFPQVGDVVFAAERDKIVKLFSLISDEINQRKKLFADYNGEYKNYCKNSGTKVPIKLVIINNYDSFKENYAAYEEILMKFTREGERYGILFYISAANSRSIYSKIARNCHNTFALDMLDRNDYVDIFGKIGNVYPAECEGRGLFKDEEVMEFQSAQITDPDNLVEFIKTTATEIMKTEQEKAPGIPVLPDQVTVDMLDKYMTNVEDLPLGISKRTLKVATYNFIKEKGTIVASRDIVFATELLRTIIAGFRKTRNLTVLIDTEQELSEIGGIVDTYVDKNFEDFILKFEQYLDSEIDGKDVKLMCIIAGLEKFQGSMNESKFQGFFNGIKTLSNVNLIFVDSSFKMKKVGFESWYTSIIDNSNGIWVGPGFFEQAVITSQNSSASSKEQVDNSFAWIVKKGSAELVKIVGKKAEEDEK